MLKIPFNGTVIVTQKYRPDPKNPHWGTDYAIEHRTSLISLGDGIVSKACYKYSKDTPLKDKNWIANTSTDPFKKTYLGKIVIRPLTTADYGNFVKIDHGHGVSTLYAHLDEVLVYEGQNIKEGQLVGYSDDTGNSTGNHLHFEIRVNERVIDPDKFDYSFKCEGGVEEHILVDMQDQVEITNDVYVRKGPATSYNLAGSRILHKGDEVDVIGLVEGEEVEGNKLWYKSKLGNYFWAGCTNKPDLPVKEEEKKMTIEEFEARKVKLDARKKELEDAMIENAEEFKKFDEEYQAFVNQPVETVAEPVAEPVVEVSPEAPVEAPAEAVVDPEVEKKSRLDALYEELKALLGK